MLKLDLRKKCVWRWWFLIPIFFLTSWQQVWNERRNHFAKTVGYKLVGNDFVLK